jgi:hypothetical protein
LLYDSIATKLARYEGDERERRGIEISEIQLGFPCPFW